MADATFHDFALNPTLQKAIVDAGYKAPSPIQAQTIPGILEGRDAMACAPTGTGKTAAFVLPALNMILNGPSKVSKGHGPRVLVLTPTRELAEQVTNNVKLFSKHARVSSGIIIGGVGYGPQYKLLSNPLDMLIATPGRLIDHLNERKVDLRRVEMLVLDEADRMLDMGFLKPVEKIIAAVQDAGGNPQTLLFSATFEDAIEKVAQRVLTNPIRVQLAAARETHTSITHKAFLADNTEHKNALLQKLLRQKDVAQAIIFTATKRNADRLAEALYDSGFAASALHGDMKQNQRKRTLEGLHKGSLQVLVATDVAARGIDVKNLSHVFNYDLPNLADDFTHRIGRTGRGGAVGIAISIVSPPDLPVLRDIEKRLGKAFPFESFPGLESTHTEADFRKIIPSEPPPGRPKPKPRGGGFGGKRDGGYGGKREGGFGAKREGGFAGKREGGFSGNREGGSYNKSSERGERAPRAEGGNSYGPKREGGYAGKREGGFGGRSEGGYGAKREGGYAGKRDGGNFAAKRDSAPRRDSGRPQRRDGR